jgi:hypothetical protein
MKGAFVRGSKAARIPHSSASDNPYKEQDRRYAQWDRGFVVGVIWAHFDGKRRRGILR